MEIENPLPSKSKPLIPGISNGVVLVQIFPCFTQHDLWKLAQSSKTLQSKIEEIFKKSYLQKVPIERNDISIQEVNQRPDDCTSYLNYYILLLKLQNSHSFHHKKWFSEANISESEISASYSSIAERIIDKTFLPNKALYLKGVLAEMRCDLFNAGKFYLQSHDKSAQKRIANAVTVGGFAQIDNSKEKRFETYLELAKQGNLFAHENMINAIYKGNLGQEKRSENERFDDIMRFVEEGDPIAKSVLAEILYNGELGEIKNPEEERLEKIKKFAEEGNLRASELLAKAVFSGSFGYIAKPKEERMSELIEMARKGNKGAIRCVVENLASGGFGLSTRSINERFEEIKRFAEKGDKYAQQKLVYILHKGDMGQNSRSEEERYEELVGLFRKGNRYAEFSVPLSVYKGSFGQGSLTEMERFEKLVKLKEMGNKPAETFLALWKDGRTSQEMFDRLLVIALKGNKHTQDRVLDALMTEEIEQSEITQKFAKLYFELLNQVIWVNRIDYDEITSDH